MDNQALLLAGSVNFNVKELILIGERILPLQLPRSCLLWDCRGAKEPQAGL